PYLPSIPTRRSSDLLLWRVEKPTRHGKQHVRQQLARELEHPVERHVADPPMPIGFAYQLASRIAEQEGTGNRHWQAGRGARIERSEEHTSELQSREN